MRRALYLIITILHLCVFEVALFFGGREAAVFRYGAESDPEFRGRVIDGSVDVGYSVYSTTRLMTNCLIGLESFEQKLDLEPNRVAYSKKCGDFSRVVLSSSPYNSLGWIVNASSWREAGNYAAMSRGLANSQLLAPNEQWLAINRYQLVANSSAELSMEAELAYDADLGLLAQSRFGVDAIARRYVNNPAFRDHVTDIVAKLPNETQTRFLNSIRAVMNNTK